jgi:nicotinate-nucleotide adenylyltransferase
MKVGILGGTFNPVHIGHLIMAEEIMEKALLSRVIFVPTYLPPHKDNIDVAPAADRFKMLKLAVSNNRNFHISDIEIRRQGQSYTIDTVKELKKLFPRDELYFITGSDLLKYLDAWKDLSEILKLVKFLVATRPGYPLEKIPSYISTVSIRAVDISGFEVRQAARQGCSFRYLVPERVFNYINAKKLYRK